MKKVGILFLTLALILVSVLGMAEKDTLTVVLDREPVSFDPVDVFVNVKSMIDNCIYDTLIKIDNDGHAVPGLAESWEQVDDTTWKLTLREGVKFHNGKDLTAEDVLYSLGRVKESSVTAAKAAFIDLENTTFEGNVITLKLSQPYAFVEAQLGNPQFAIVCKEVVENTEGAYGREPVGSGPWKFVSWTAGDRIELTRNDEYWGEKAKLTNLVFRIITESASRTIELESGGVDIVLSISTNDAARIDENPDTVMVSRSSNSLRYLGFNCDKPELSDVRVRKALAHATDTAILREILYGLNTSGPALSCVPEGMIGQNMDLVPYEYNPEKAKELLKEAGYENGLEIEFMYLANSTNNMLAELLQQLWGEVGVTLVLQPTESGALSTALNKGEHMLCSAGTTATLGEAGELLNNMFSLASKGSSSNRTNLTNEAVDALLQKVIVTPNAEERAKLVYEVQALVHEDCPMIYLCSQYSNMGLRSDVKGFVPHQNSMHNFGTVYFE